MDRRDSFDSVEEEVNATQRRRLERGPDTWGGYSGPQALLEYYRNLDRDFVSSMQEYRKSKRRYLGARRFYKHVKSQLADMHYTIIEHMLSVYLKDFIRQIRAFCEVHKFDYSGMVFEFANGHNYIPDYEMYIQRGQILTGECHSDIMFTALRWLLDAFVWDRVLVDGDHAIGRRVLGCLVHM